MPRFPTEDLPQPENESLTITERLRHELDRARREWNRRHGELASIRGFRVIGTITASEETEGVEEWLLHNMIMPSGDVLNPEDMILETPEPEEARRGYGPILHDHVTPGRGLLRTEWVTKDEEEFSTLTIVNNTGIEFDSMLSNVFYVEAVEVPDDSRMSDCRSRVVYWVFTNIERGKVSACVQAVCPGPVRCNFSAQGWMNIGSWISTLTPMPPAITGNCCNAIWAWGLMTPLVSGTVAFNAAGIAVNMTFSGIGSSAGGVVSLTDCCPVPQPNVGAGNPAYSAGEPVDIQSPRRGTCQSEHPEMLDCVDDLPHEYRYNSLEDLLRHVRAAVGEDSVEAVNERTASDGPCAGEGKHWTLRDSKGDHHGSATSCPCCEDEIDGPVKKALYRWIH